MFNFRIESWTMGSLEIDANYFVWQIAQHGYHEMCNPWKVRYFLSTSNLTICSCSSRNVKMTGTLFSTLLYVW